MEQLNTTREGYTYSLRTCRAYVQEKLTDIIYYFYTLSYIYILTIYIKNKIHILQHCCSDFCINVIVQM